MATSSSRTRSPATAASAGGSRARGLWDAGIEPPPRPQAQAHAAQDAHGVVGQRARAGQPDRPGREIGQAPGGIGDGGAAVAHQRGHGSGQGVDGEVARAEVAVERRRAEVDDVHLRPPRHPAGPAPLVEGDERPAEPRGQHPPEVERARGHRDVQIGRGGARQQLPHGAADEPGGPALRERRDRGQRLARRRPEPGRVEHGRRRHGSPSRRLALSPNTLR